MPPSLAEKETDPQLTLPDHRRRLHPMHIGKGNPNNLWQLKGMDMPPVEADEKGVADGILSPYCPSEPSFRSRHPMG
jgi:hypothetical protein